MRIFFFSMMWKIELHRQDQDAHFMSTHIKGSQDSSWSIHSQIFPLTDFRKLKTMKSSVVPLFGSFVLNDLGPINKESDIP